MSAGWRCVPGERLLSAGAVTHSGSPLRPPWTSDQAQQMESPAGSRMAVLGNLSFLLQSLLFGPVSWLEVLDSLTLPPCSGAGSAPGFCPGTERPRGPRAGTLHVTRSKSLKPPVPRSLPLQSGANDSYLSAPTVLTKGKATPFSMYLCMLHTTHVHVITTSCLFQIKIPESGMEK